MRYINSRRIAIYICWEPVTHEHPAERSLTYDRSINSFIKVVYDKKKMSCFEQKILIEL